MQRHILQFIFFNILIRTGDLLNNWNKCSQWVKLEKNCVSIYYSKFMDINESYLLVLWKVNFRSFVKKAIGFALAYIGFVYSKRRGAGKSIK